MDAIQFSHLPAQILLRLNARILSIISVRHLKQWFPAKTANCVFNIFSDSLQHFNVGPVTVLEIGFVDSGSRVVFFWIAFFK